MSHKLVALPECSDPVIDPLHCMLHINSRL